MGFFKQCKCKTPEVCPHPYHARTRGVKMSLEKFLRKPVRTPAEARKAFVLFEAAVIGGTVHRGAPKPEGYRIPDLIEDYLRDYFIPKGRVLHKEKYIFRAIEKRFGNVKPEDLTLLDVTRWVNTMRAQGVGPATVRRHIARLKAILNWGFNMELVPQQRIRWGALDLEKEPEGRPRRLEEGEEERLKAAARPWLRQLIEAALDTGLRAGALLGLTVDMVQGNELVVPRRLLKNKRASHDLRIPLTARLKAILEYRSQGLGPKAHIFGNDQGRKRKWFRGAWEAALREAGIKYDSEKGWDLHFHDLRGEFATRLHEAGVAIETISYLLDHATIEMTRRYIKVRTRSSKPAEAIAALEQFQQVFAAQQQKEKDEASNSEVAH